MNRWSLVGALLFAVVTIDSAGRSVAAEELTAAARGYDLLRHRQYLPPDFDKQIFDSLWTVWPEPEQSAAATADTKSRRRQTFSYYGLIQAPEDKTETAPPLGYVADDQGNWSMNCLACHGGKVAGRVIPGLPNSHIALQTLAEDVRRVKLAQGKPFSHLDFGSLQMPLAFSNGSTNSVVFGIVLATYRRPDMSVDLNRTLPPLSHHDVDAPPFWNVRKKQSLYCDGFSPKTARPLMQFILLPRVTPAELEEWEPDFADILSWIESLESPRYPFEIDQALADQGQGVFNRNCSQCHGIYGPKGEYHQQTIAIDQVDTDPTRLKALTPKHRNWMKVGWLSHYGQDSVDVDPVGYVAPPLDGIWASAPYLHNGSVPTLWHLLHPDSRPVTWLRSEDGYDQMRVGLEIEELAGIPETEKSPAHRRKYFDTRIQGKSAQGHRFPDALSEEEKNAVLEYLKTL